MGNLFLFIDNKFVNRASIYHISTYILKKIVDLKNKFLRIFFWRFIEVKRNMKAPNMVLPFNFVTSGKKFTIYYQFLLRVVGPYTLSIGESSISVRFK